MDIVLALLSVICVAYSLVELAGVKPSSSFLGSCSLIIIALTVFGALNILSLGVALVLICSLLLLLCSALHSKKKAGFRQSLAEFLDPGSVFFIFASLTVWIVCVIRQPAFRNWDEFSFWGIAAKVIWSCRELYTTAGTSMITSAYLPGLPLFGAFFQYFFNDAFTEYKVYIAYDVLMIASLVTIFADIKWKNIIKAAVTALFCICFLGLFSSCYGQMNPMFSCYSDTVIGLVFGGTLLTWFMHKEKDLSVWLSTCLGLALLTCMKDIGLALDFIIAGTISLDMIIGRSYPRRFAEKRSVLNLIYCAAMFMIPVVIYVGWLKYFTSVTGIVSSEIPYPYSFVDIVIRGKDPRFLMFVDQLMGSLDQQLVNFGSIKIMSFVFLAYPIVAIFLLDDRNLILRTSLTSLCLLFGFIVYNIFFLYLYTSVFKYNELANYQRYMSSYVIGWGFAVSGLASIDFVKAKSDLLKKLLFYSYMILISVCAVFFAAPFETEFAISETRIQYQNLYDKYCSDLDTDDRLFVVCQDSDGGEWMILNYELLPAYTVPTYVTGNLIKPGTEHHTIYDVEATAEDIVGYITDQEVDYVVVLNSNDYFREEFGKLFADDLDHYYDGSCCFYEVTRDPAGSMSLIPMVTEEQISSLHS